VDATRLAAIPFFAGLEDGDLAEVASAASEVDAAEGDLLASEGDFGHALYAIEQGTATVSAGGVVLRVLQPGESSARSPSSRPDGGPPRSSRPRRCA